MKCSNLILFYREDSLLANGTHRNVLCNSSGLVSPLFYSGIMFAYELGKLFLSMYFRELKEVVNLSISLTDMLLNYIPLR